MRTTLPQAARAVRQAPAAARSGTRPASAFPAPAYRLESDADLDRARRFGHRWEPPAVVEEPPAPRAASAAVTAAATPLQLTRGKQTKAAKKPAPRKKEEPEPESEPESEPKSEPESEPESESESDPKSESESEPEPPRKKKRITAKEPESESEEASSGGEEEEEDYDILGTSTNLFGQMAGKASAKGATFRPPRSYPGRREEQVSKHFTTLLRTAGEHSAKKDKEKDPVEVQSSYLGGNLYFSTNSTTASKNLVNVVKSGGGTRKVLEGTKQPDKAVRRKTHARIQSKVKKTFADTREIKGTDPVDVERAKRIAEIMKGSPELTFLDPSQEAFAEQLEQAKTTPGKAYVVPGDKHAELNVAEFRDKHLADVADDRARTYGSKRNCATCHGEMHAKHPKMASGQGPGLLVKNQIPVISKPGRKRTFEQMRGQPTHVTLLQHGKMDTGTASDSDTDDEGKVMAKIPTKDPKLPGKPKRKGR